MGMAYISYDQSYSLVERESATLACAVLRAGMFEQRACTHARLMWRVAQQSDVTSDVSLKTVLFGVFVLIDFGAHDGRDRLATAWASVRSYHRLAMPIVIAIWRARNLALSSWAPRFRIGDAALPRVARANSFVWPFLFLLFAAPNSVTRARRQASRRRRQTRTISYAGTIGFGHSARGIGAANFR